MMASLSIEQRLQCIEARSEITDLVARYALGADRKNDPAIMGPLFAERATWAASGFSAFEGREAIAAGLAAIAEEQVLWSIHFMVSPLITLADDGRTGTCQWYLWELCTMQGPDGPRDTWLGGWYDSLVGIEDDRWKFTKVLLDIRVQGNALPPWMLKKAPQQ
jgi:hypothetical protein